MFVCREGGGQREVFDLVLLLVLYMNPLCESKPIITYWLVARCHRLCFDWFRLWGNPGPSCDVNSSTRVSHCHTVSVGVRMCSRRGNNFTGFFSQSASVVLPLWRLWGGTEWGEGVDSIPFAAGSSEDTDLSENERVRELNASPHSPSTGMDILYEM